MVPEWLHLDMTSAPRSARPQLLLLAGAMGTGKTTLANELSRILAWPVATTSAYISRVVAAKGLEPTRSRIQNIGMYLVANDVISFATLFLRDSGWSPGAPLIVDSVRQPVVYSALVSVAAPSRVSLTFLQAPFDVRAGRVRAREGMTVEELRRFDGHPVESEVPRLRPLADLVLTALDETRDLAAKVLDSLI